MAVFTKLVNNLSIEVDGNERKRPEKVYEILFVSRWFGLGMQDVKFSLPFKIFSVLFIRFYFTHPSLKSDIPASEG